MAVSLLQRHFLHVKWLLNSNGPHGSSTPILATVHDANEIQQNYCLWRQLWYCVSRPAWKAVHCYVFFSLRLCCLLSTRHNRACFAPGGCDHTHRLPNMCPPCMCENLPGRCLSFAFCGSPGTRALSVITHAALAVTFEIWGGKNSPIAIAWGC